MRTAIPVAVEDGNTRRVGQVLNGCMEDAPIEQDGIASPHRHLHSTSRALSTGQVAGLHKGAVGPRAMTSWHTSKARRVGRARQKEPHLERDDGRVPAVGGKEPGQGGGWYLRKQAAGVCRSPLDLGVQPAGVAMPCHHRAFLSRLKQGLGG